MDKPIDPAVESESPRATTHQRRRAALQLGAVVAVAAAVAVADTPRSALPRLGVWILLLAGLGLTTLEVFARYGLTSDPRLADKSSRQIFMGWIAAETRQEAKRLELFRELFYDGRDSSLRVARFVILMGFASVIATAGIVADSTAVVIGAMLVAPLITPMMGMSLGLTMGWQSKIRRAGLLVLAGTVIAIAVGFILPFITTAAIDSVANSQIVSRSTPTLIDLIIAIAAGAAGAYAVSRPDVSSSLPGVAVAIALVPPLCVMGVMLHEQEWDLATGAALLFATNLIAILITGGLVFALTGIAPLERLSDGQNRAKVALTSLAVVAVGVVGALAANGAAIATDSLNADRARTTTVNWLEGSEFGLATLTLNDGVATVILTGPGDPPPAELLASDLSEALGQEITLDLQWIPRSQVIVTPDGLPTLTD